MRGLPDRSFADKVRHMTAAKIVEEIDTWEAECGAIFSSQVCW